MDTRKLGKPSDQRLALVSNLATDLLWYGHIETTFDRAKAAARLAEQIITLAVNTYEDVVTSEKVTLDNNGKEKKVTVSKDGALKLAARRKIIALVQNRQEQRKKDMYISAKWNIEIRLGITNVSLTIQLTQRVPEWIL